MVRGVPWDDLPSPYIPPGYSEQVVEQHQDAQPQELEVVEHKFDFERDIMDIGRRVAFGVVCGSITGACFGIMDVLRDPSAMSGKRSVGTNKVLRFTYLFGGYFGAYHGTCKVLQISPIPLDRTYNIVGAAALCTLPLIALPRLRPLIPYSVMLVAIDAFNEFNDSK